MKQLELVAKHWLWKAKLRRAVTGRKWSMMRFLDGRLKTNLQVTEAFKYVKENGEKSTVEGMEAASGVRMICRVTR